MGAESNAFIARSVERGQPIDDLYDQMELSFNAWIEDPSYKSKQRLTQAQYRELSYYCRHPNEPGKTASERNNKHRALTDFETIDGILHRKPMTVGSKEFGSRYCTTVSAAWNLIKTEHQRVSHAGRDKTWAEVQARYCGITKEEVAFFIDNCKHCQANNTHAVRPPMTAITSSNPMERCQADLIDMRTTPSSNYKAILHIMVSPDLIQASASLPIIY